MNREDGFGLQVSQERLAEYLKDYQSDNCEATEFWSYVAGREHGKEIVEPVKPVKAWWENCKHEKIFTFTGKCKVCGRKVE